MEQTTGASLFRMYQVMEKNHGKEEAETWIESSLTDGEKVRLYSYRDLMQQKKSARKSFSVVQLTRSQ